VPFYKDRLRFYKLPLLIIKVLLILYSSVLSVCVAQSNEEYFYTERIPPKSSSLLLVRINTHHLNSEVKDIDHFLEHMLFKGSLHFPQFGQFNAYLDSEKVKSNGKSFFTYIELYFHIPNKNLNKVVENISKHLNSPLFLEAHIIKEMNVFFEETSYSKFNALKLLSSCFVRSKKKERHLLENMAAQDIALSLKSAYKQIWQIGNVDFFLFSSEADSKLKAIARKVSIGASDSKLAHSFSFTNSGSYLFNSPQKTTICSDNLPITKKSAIVTYDAQDLYIPDEMSLLLDLLILDRSSDSLTSTLGRLTAFSEVAIISNIDNQLRFVLKANHEYTIGDAQKARVILYAFLKQLSEQGFPNASKKARFFSLSNKLTASIENFLWASREATKVKFKRFEGKSLNIISANYAKELLNRRSAMVLSGNFKRLLENNNYNNSLVVKGSEKVESFRFSDLAENKLIPPIKALLKYESKLSESNNARLQFKSSNFAYQILNQNAQVSLSSVLLQLKFVDKNSAREFSEDFEVNNREFIEKLQLAAIGLNVESFGSFVNIKLSGYSFNIEYVISQVSDKLLKVEGRYFAAKALLLGGMKEGQVNEVYNVFREKLEKKSTGVVLNSKKANKQCIEPCLYSNINSLLPWEAEAFSLIFEQTFGQIIFHTIRLEEAQTYDTGTYLSFSYQMQPKIVFYISNKGVSLGDFKQKLKAIGAKFLSRSTYEEHKKKLLLELKLAQNYKEQVVFYWEGLGNGKALFNDYSKVVEALEKMSYEKFIKEKNDVFGNITAPR